MACDDDLTSLAENVNEKLSPALEASCGLTDRSGARYNQRRTVRDLARNFLGIPASSTTPDLNDVEHDNLAIRGVVKKRLVGFPAAATAQTPGARVGSWGSGPEAEWGGGVTTSPPQACLAHEGNSTFPAGQSQKFRRLPDALLLVGGRPRKVVRKSPSIVGGFQGRPRACLNKREVRPSSLPLRQPTLVCAKLFALI